MASVAIPLITALIAFWYNHGALKQKAGVDLVSGAVTRLNQVDVENQNLRKELDAASKDILDMRTKQFARDGEMLQIKRDLDDCKQRRATDDSERRRLLSELDQVRLDRATDNQYFSKKIEEFKAIVRELLKQLEENEIKPRVKPGTDQLKPNL